MFKLTRLEAFGLATEHFYENELSQRTLEQYKWSIKQYMLRFGDEWGKDNALIWKRELLATQSASTAFIRIQIYNKICDLAGHHEERIKGVRKPKAKHVENVISKDEYETLLAYLKGADKMKFYFVVKFLANTGCRVGELINLKKKHLLEGEAIIYNKGDMRIIRIPQTLIDESAEFFKDHKPEEFLFLNRFGNQITSRGVAQEIRNNGRRAGIRKEVLHPHGFRHFYAIQLLEATGDITLVSDMLNHKDLSTTQIYTRRSKEEQRRMLNNAIDW